MSNATGKVVMLRTRNSKAALDSLNRITGLRFSQWPESLVCMAGEGTQPVAHPSPNAESCVAKVSQAFA